MSDEWSPEGDMGLPTPAYTGEEPVLAGHTTDDDGVYIDELVSDNPNLTTPFHLPVESPANDIVTYDTMPPETTRIIGGRLTLAVGDPPVRALPADPNRISLMLTCNSLGTNTGSEPVIWSSESSLCHSDLAGASLLTAQPFNTSGSGCHTGPVYVRPLSTNTAGSTVWYVAVTK